MGAWGLPWDAFVMYRQAHDDDPTWNEPATLGDQMMSLMRDVPGRGRTPAAAPP
jgi:hypothetical protein